MTPEAQLAANLPLQGLLSGQACSRPPRGICTWYSILPPGIFYIFPLLYAFFLKKKKKLYLPFDPLCLFYSSLSSDPLFPLLSLLKEQSKLCFEKNFNFQGIGKAKLSPLLSFP